MSENRYRMRKQERIYKKEKNCHRTTIPEGIAHLILLYPPLITVWEASNRSNAFVLIRQGKLKAINWETHRYIL
jgi:hypothetical protein